MGDIVMAAGDYLASGTIALPMNRWAQRRARRGNLRPWVFST
jgi:hypothetical protein